MMTTNTIDDTVRQQIINMKQVLRPHQSILNRAFQELDDEMRRQADRIQAELTARRSCIPEINFADIRDSKVTDQVCNTIRQRGAVIIRNVFARSQAEQWNSQLEAYIDDNDYYTKQVEKRDLDKYFSDLISDKPQIFGLYWSKPQVMARQAEAMAISKRFLNRLWQFDSVAGHEFDPDHDYAYADRVRRREPGDTTLGLSPHMDAGSFERWIDPAFQKIYASVFAGQWREFEPFNAAYRTKTKEYPSPAVCSMFRTFQGWTALTEQGPHDGTLQLVPIANGIAYLLLRALMDDVPEDELCGAQPGRALGALPKWHPSLLAGLVSIPTVEPGDTVWWHPDIIHAVEDRHQGQNYSNVIYIGASPRCEKNKAFAAKQAQAFLAGKSSPDFAAEDYEVDFKDRATLADLTELGKAQMGL